MVGVAQHLMVVGNVYEVWKEVRGVGQRARGVGRVVPTPTLHYGGVSVTTKINWNGFERDNKAL